MEKKNLKCPKCGYTFFGDVQKQDGICPLCSEKYITEKALEYYKLTADKESTAQTKKSTSRIIADWLIFGVSFALFILILYVIISFIAGTN